MTARKATCESCQFFGEGMSKFGKSICRRNPPQPNGTDEGGMPITDWPIVNPSDWCGEFVMVYRLKKD